MPTADFPAMLAALPVEFFEAYGKILYLDRNGDNYQPTREWFLEVGAWPPSTDALLRMARAQAKDPESTMVWFQISLHADGCSAYWEEFRVRQAPLRHGLGSEADLTAMLLRLTCAPLGYEWDGKEWREGEWK